MLIAVEGIDGSGKTTLIATLRERLKENVVCISRPTGPRSLIQMLDQALWLAQHPPTSILLVDRHPYISEEIYGPVLRDRSKFENVSEAQRTLIRDSISGVIYCRPFANTIIKNIEGSKDRQLAGVPEKVKTLIAAYDEFMYDWKGRLVEYDYTNHTIDPLLEAISTWYQTDLQPSSRSNES